MFFQPEITIQPIDDWFSLSGRGDLILHDPFSGEALTSGSNFEQSHKVPADFLGNITMKDGRDYLMNAHYMKLRRLGVLLAEPSSADGLGSQPELDEAISSFDAVAYTTERSVLLDNRFSRTVQELGGITLGGEIAPSNDYLERLFDTASKCGTHLVDINIPRGIDGLPMSPEGRALQKVKDVVVTQQMAEKNPDDPSLGIVAADFVYTNNLDWHNTLMTGASLANMIGEFGTMPESMLLIVPPEHADMGRKIDSLTDKSISMHTHPAKASFFGGNSPYEPYVFANERGYIPHQAASGAEY